MAIQTASEMKKYKNATALSSYIGMLKDKKISYSFNGESLTEEEFINPEGDLWPL